MSGPRALDIVATNVAGLGAVQLTQSLLPALEAASAVGRIYLPDRGPLAAYRPHGARAVATRRRLPNALSRLAECTIGGRRFDRGEPLLVLGDVPLRVAARQTVVVQTPHLLARFSPATGREALRYRVMRAVFRTNAPRVAAFVVQSAVMRDALTAEYGIEPNRVHIVQQPPPAWLTAAPPPPRSMPGERLRLFYPAAGYPHKNHRLLTRLDPAAWAARVERLVVTLAQSPAALPEIDAVGHLDPAGMRSAYAAADALLFLSTAESYGFPLVEAMWLGLPIVAADLPYAHALCGAQAFYFDPHDPAALLAALDRLRDRLAAGWRPDWRAKLAPLPRDWTAVANALATIAIG